MASWMFWKTLGDLCLYISAVSAVPALFPYTMSFFLPVLICAAGVTGAVILSRHGRAAYVCLALPVLSLLFAGSIMEVLLLLPAVAYSCAVILRQNFFLEYYDFRESFLRNLRIWCIAFLVVAIFHGLEAQSGGKTVLATREPLLYGMVWVLSGIRLCRVLRMGAQSDRKHLSGKMTVAAAVLLCSGAVCAAALERLLQSRATSLSQLLGQLMMLLLGFPGQLFGRFIYWAISLVDKGYMEYFQDKEQQLLEITTAPPLPTEAATEQAARESLGFPWWLAVIVLTGLGLLLVRMLRSLRGRAPVTISAEYREQLQQQKKKRPERRSNRSTVRKYYRAFLKAEKRKGMRLHTSQTSADILKNISATTAPDAAEELRGVYLAARYDTGGKITARQVETARNALRKIKNSDTR